MDFITMKTKTKLTDGVLFNVARRRLTTDAERALLHLGSKPVVSHQVVDNSRTFNEEGQSSS